MPRGFHIASAWVDIHAEDTGLRQQVERMIKKAVAGQKFEIPVKINDKNLRNELTRAMKKATAGQGVAIPVKIDSKNLRREFQNAVKSATAGNKKVMVPIGIDSKGLRAELKRAILAAAAGERIRIPAKIDVDARQVQRVLDGADATVNVNVDVQRMRQQLMAAIRRINVNEDVTINTNIDGDALRNQIKSEIGRLRDKFRVRIGADIDTDTFAARLRAAARQVAGTHADIPVDLNPNINRLKLRAEVAAAAAALRPKINFHGDLNAAMTRAKLMASLRLASAGLFIRVPVRTDRNQIRQVLGSISSALDDIMGPSSRWGKILMAGALAALPALGAADHMLRKIGASSAVAVPIITGLTEAFAGLYIGLQGIGTVMSGVFNQTTYSDHQMAVFETTLEGLAPSARKFAEVLKDIKDKFTDLRKSVQGVLFQGMDKELGRFARNTLPVLKLGLSGTSEQFNRMGKDMLNVIDQSARSGEMIRAFGAVQTALEPLVPLPGQFLNALTKLTIAASPLLTRMNTALERWAKNMTEKMNTAFDNGTLQASISRAGDSIVRFFHNIANNPEFNRFLHHMEEVGPRMSNLFENLAEALFKVLNALAPISGAFATLANVFANIIKWIPTELLEMLIIKIVLLKVAVSASLWIGKLTLALIALKEALIALRSTEAMVGLLGTKLRALGLSAAGVTRVAGAVRGLGITALALTSVTALFHTLGWAIERLFGDGRVHANIDKTSQSLVTFAHTGEMTGEASRVFGKDFGKLGEAIKQIGNPNTWDYVNHGFKRLGNALHINGDDWQRQRDTMKSADKVLVDMVKSGHMEEAAVNFDRMAKEADKNGVSTKKLKELLPEYTKTLAQSKAAQLMAADTMGIYGRKALEVKSALDAQKKAAEGVRMSIGALADAHRAAAGGEITMEAAIDALTKSLKDNGAAFDSDSEKGRTNRQAALDLAGATKDAAMAKFEETGTWTEANKVYDRGYNSLVKLLQGLNNTATGAKYTKAEAEKLAKAWIGIPNRKVSLGADIEDLNKKIKEAQDKVDTLKQKRKTAVGADKTKLDAEIRAAQAEIDALKQKRKVVIDAMITDLETKITAAQAKVDGLKQKRKTAVGADRRMLNDEIEKAQKKVDSLKQRKAAALYVANHVGTGVSAAQKMIDALEGKTVTVNVKINGQVVGVDPSKYYSQGPHKGSRYGGPIRRAMGGMVTAFNGGGISGPGGPTSDIIQAMLSNGEFVMRAAAVKKYGMNFFNMLNKGMFPKFAQGGSVGKYAGGGPTVTGSKSGTLANALVKITGDTRDIDAKLKKTQNLLNVLKAPKPVTLKAADGTKKATDSAKANMRSVGTVNQQTFTKIKLQTTTFTTQWTAQMNGLKGKNSTVWKSIGSGLSSNITSAYTKVKTSTTTFSNSLNSQMNSIKTRNATVWKSVGTSLQTSVTNAYNKVKTATVSFGNATVASVSSIKNKTNAQWTSLGTSMQNRTKSMYTNIKNATNSFGNQNVAKFKSISNNTGSAWGTLGPKFKPPVSYLIHTVINKGVVGGMNAIISKLQGGKKVGGISVSGFAGGGHIQGAGSKTSDSILARLSRGEFVMRASAVDKYGPQFMHAMNEGRLPGFASGGMITRPMISVKVPGFASGGSVPSSDSLNKMIGSGSTAGYRKVADWVLQHIVNPLIGDGPGGSAMKDTMAAGVKYLEGNMATFLEKNVLPSFMGGKIPSGSRLAIINAALKAAGVPPPGTMAQWQAGLNTLITRESGWNASAINRWDSNAKAGHPSQGLAQTIPSTFNAYVPKSLRSRGILDPVANVAAAIRYIVARYGNITRVQQANANARPQGYAVGGPVHGPGTGRSDSIATRLSSGEFVVRASSVNKYGRGFLDALNSGALPMPHLATGGTTYTIKRGDTLGGIAKKYKISLSALLNANPSYKSHPNTIYPGKKLVIPGKTSGGSSGGGSSPVSKAPKGDIQSTDAASALKGLVTIGEVSTLANKHGANIQNETLKGLSAQDSFASLWSNLNETKSAISAAFKGKTQDALLKRFTQTADKLIPLQMRLDKVRKSLEDAQQSLEDVKGKFDNLKNSVADSIVQFGSITKIGKYGTSAGTIIGQLQKDVGKSQQFAGMLEQLKAKGVSGDLIEQIASAGITGGGMWTADSLLKASPAEIAQINDLQKQLTTAADKAGTAAADAAYGAGVKAAEGLVKGLQAQEKAIMDQMSKIAQSLVTAIKQALGIKSPSRVMAQVGHFTAMGFVQGMGDKEKEIKNAVLRLGGIPGQLVPTTPKAPEDGTIKNGCVTIENLNITVNGTFDISSPKERRKLAEALGKDVKEVIRLDDRKRA